MNKCVCGFNPPAEPNPDCERCQLVCEVERLKSHLLDMAAAPTLWGADPDRTDILRNKATKALEGE